MASQISLRQASRAFQSNRLHLNPSRTRQYSSHPSLTTRSPLARVRSPHTTTNHVLQQTRSLSLWSSGSSKPEAPTAPPTTSTTADVSITDPSQLETNYRTVKASHATSAELEPHRPNPLEPQAIEDAQQRLLEPHLSDPASVTPDLASLPERIGYLAKDCGLDFGWGPTSTMEWILEHLHVWGGLSWTAAIVLMGFTLRGTMFPFLVGSAKTSAKLREISHVIKPIQEEMAKARANADQQKMMQLSQQIKIIYQQSQINFLKPFFPLLVQLPFGFGAWRILRNAASLPVPGFVNESWLWTNDLTFSDPYFIIPALSSSMIYLSLRSQAAANGGAGQATEGFMQILQKLMPALSFVFMVFQPGAVQLYFVSSSFAGLLTARGLQNSSIRKFLDIPPLPGKQPPPAGTVVEATGREVRSSYSSPSSPTPSSSSSPTSTPPSPVQPKTPGGLRLRHTPSPTSTSPSTTTETSTATAEARRRDISAIDRGVEWIKDQRKDLAESIRKSTESQFGKQEDRAAKARRDAQEVEDAKARAREDMRRKQRNAQAGIEEEEERERRRRR